MLAWRALDSDWALTVEVTGGLPNILITTNILTPRGNLLWNENLKGDMVIAIMFVCIALIVSYTENTFQEKADLF